MNSILVYLSVSSGKIRRSSLEVLSRCRAIADREGLLVVAAMADPEAPSLVKTASDFGADQVYAFSDAGFAKHVNEPLLELLSRLVQFVKPRLIALAGTEGGKDILGALAVRVGAAAIPDVSSFDIEGATVKAVRPVMAAKKLAEVETDSERVIVSVRSGSYAAVEKSGTGELSEFSFVYDEVETKQSVQQLTESSTGAVDLSEASVVVSAGRGIKDEGGLALVDQLATELGGAIGATRAVVENGLYPATAQIGQTGKVVSPELYIAVGISGAIQHVAGMSNSRVIVAVNKDPDAPIFEYATYGIVGDLYKVLPLLHEKIVEAKAAN